MKIIDRKVAPCTVPELLKLATEENVFIRTPEGKEFVLAEVDDFDREIALVRQNDALMKLLEEQSKETEQYTLGQAKEMLGLD